MTAFDARRVARTLTGDMDIRAFNENIRERRAARFEAAVDAEQLLQLFDLARVESLFVSDAIPLANVDLFEDGHLKRLVDMQKKSGKTGLAVVAERFRAGATVRLRDVDEFDVRLNQLVAEVRRQFAAQSQVNVYLTPPAKDGFPPHFDITDVFVVQCLGAKQWRVFDDYACRIDLPLVDTNWEPDRFRPSAAPDAIPLSAGDVLYVPRGVMHEASCTDCASMHLTISVTPLTFYDLISRELRRVADTNIEFRRRMPWGVDEGDARIENVIAEVARGCLRELAARLDVAAVVQEARRSIQGNGDDVGAAFDLTAAVGGLFERHFEQVSNPARPAAADSLGDLRRA